MVATSMPSSMVIIAFAAAIIIWLSLASSGGAQRREAGTGCEERRQPRDRLPPGKNYVHRRGLCLVLHVEPACVSCTHRVPLRRESTPNLTSSLSP
jgi:hypothetical protein